MKWIQSKGWQRKLYPDAVWEMPAGKNEIYLTFDDGPTDEITSWVLNELAAFEAKASFFCVGRQIELHPALFEKVKKSHSIGNHSFSHPKGWKTSSTRFIEDVLKCDKLTQSNLFRPPYGKLRPKQYKKLIKAYQIIMWSVLSYDWDAEMHYEQCLRNVIDNLQDGAIIVFHDSKKAFKNLKYTLPRTLDAIYSAGFKCESIQMLHRSETKQPISEI